MHYNLVSGKLQVHMVVNNFSSNSLPHSQLALPSEGTFYLGTGVPIETQSLGHVCTYVRPQKHALKQRGSAPPQTNSESESSK